MFADKSMQGLTFPLSAFLCQVGKIERPYPALCLQMVRLALLSDGARLQMGSPEAVWSNCSSLDLCQGALMQKTARERNPGCSGLSMCSFTFLDLMPSWAHSGGRTLFSFRLVWRLQV